MANRFEIEEWLLPACVALVERQSPLTYAEAEKLGLDMTILVSEAREKYVRRLRNGSHSSYSSFVQRPSKDTIQLVKAVLDIK